MVTELKFLNSSLGGEGGPGLRPRDALPVPDSRLDLKGSWELLVANIMVLYLNS